MAADQPPKGGIAGGTDSVRRNSSYLKKQGG